MAHGKGTKQVRFGTINKVLERGRIVMEQHDILLEKKGEHTIEGQYHKGVSDGLNVIITEIEKLGD